MILKHLDTAVENVEIVENLKNLTKSRKIMIIVKNFVKRTRIFIKRFRTVISFDILKFFQWLLCNFGQFSWHFPQFLRSFLWFLGNFLKNCHVFFTINTYFNHFYCIYQRVFWTFLQFVRDFWPVLEPVHFFQEGFINCLPNFIFIWQFS